MTRWLLILVLAASLGSLAGAAVVFTLDPSGGSVTGAPGDTVGWGFEAYDDTYYLIVAASGFCTTFDTSSDTLPCQSPTNPPVAGGTYADYFSGAPFNFIDSAPGSPDTSQDTFDATSMTGLGSFTINNDPSLLGQTLSGLLVIDYNLYSCDPLVCGDPVEETNPLNNSFDFFASAPADVMVQANTNVTVPEPASVALAGFVLLAFAGSRRKKKLSTLP